MNQSLWQKLKRVRILDLLSIVLLFIAWPLSVFYRKAHPNLWLFCDCPNEARDNAFWFFQYVRENYPNQEAVFALSEHSADMPKVHLLGATVPFGSLKHWILYLSAHNIISSQKASGPNAAVCYVLEQYRLIKGNKIFLQHGIIKDNISFLYYKYTNIRLFTCSTQKELDYVRSHYGYPAKNVQLLGLCRFDRLHCLPTPRRQILIMPTWRKWLSHPTNMGNDLTGLLIKSDFYHYWMELLNSKAFYHILKEYDMTAIFYLHREMQKYKTLFSTTDAHIKIAFFPEDNVQTLLQESALLITDYSSVAMDFAYMDKPLFYYQFDYENFRKFHLQEGYFDYRKDGFGPVCQTLDSLLTAISISCQTDFGESDCYSDRRKSFFTIRDSNNCLRTWNAISEL